MRIPLSRKTRPVPLYSLLVSVVMIAVISSFTIYNSLQSKSDIIGQIFVESEFPSPSTSAFYLKPMTWLMIFIITGWVSFLDLVKDRFSLLGPNPRFVYMLFLFLITSLTFYEVLYNFMLWGAILASHEGANPDTAVNRFPDERYQINLVFSTKVGVTILVCGVYSLFKLRENAFTLARDKKQQ